MQPTNSLVNPLLTDFYQISMAYAYWKAGKANDQAVFDLYFRRNPFHGEYTVFCGLEECVRFMNAYKFTDDHIKFIKQLIPHAENEFLQFLLGLDCSQVKVWALKEGSVVFPNIPLLRVEGPLAICQLLETTLLTLVNYPSLVATNAARYRVAAEASRRADITLLEFGLRRAQGPDGGLSASRYTYIGGFNGTSNVLAGFKFGISTKGTQAHAFITAFSSFSDVNCKTLAHKETKQEYSFLDIVKQLKHQVEGHESAKESELAAFSAYAMAFPDGFLALVDTYNTLSSGVVNFLIVALALNQLGYKPVGVRLDSGDLAYLSVKTRELFRKVANQFNIPYFEHLKICASSDIDEEIIYSLNQQGHEIDIFGIGTNLVTCSGDPALGCVYKLVQINGNPRIKLSNNVKKVTIPGRKEAHRLIGIDGPIIDLMIFVGSKVPAAGDSLYCRHPFDETKRCYVKPLEVLPMHHLAWDGKILPIAVRPLDEIRTYCQQEIKSLRPDHKYRNNPTPYKVSLSDELYQSFHKLWLEESPVQELH